MLNHMGNGQSQTLARTLSKEEMIMEVNKFNNLSNVIGDMRETEEYYFQLARIIVDYEIEHNLFNSYGYEYLLPFCFRMDYYFMCHAERTKDIPKLIEYYIKNYSGFGGYKFYEFVCKLNPENIKYIPDCEKDCDLKFNVLSENGLMLKYIKSQNEKLCLVAIKQNPEALEFVDYRLITNVNNILNKYKEAKNTLNQINSLPSYEEASAPTLEEINNHSKKD
jgi:hypothetical protein